MKTLHYKHKEARVDSKDVLRNEQRRKRSKPKKARTEQSKLDTLRLKIYFKGYSGYYAKV